MVFTGQGKGKTTAALGMALRAAGHNMKILVLQFIKGTWHYGELEALKKFDNIAIQPLGAGFTWKKENLDKDRELAMKGWEEAMKAIESNTYHMVVLDEINYVLSHGLLPLDNVLDFLKNRPPSLHLVFTGRNAPPSLVEMADLVTEMVAVKHPYKDKGIKGQKGIEF